MLKKYVKVISICVLVCLILGSCSPMGTLPMMNWVAQINETPWDQRGESALTDTDLLMSEDGVMKNQSGEVIVLRGVNLGGWLLQETWMCPIVGEDNGWANWDTLNVLRERGFSEEQILNLYNTYQDNWLTEQDLDNIQELGLNCVRVPFWYRNFQYDDDGHYYEEGNMDANPGFMRLDWLIKECGERSLYVILDMHGAPGFQSQNHSSGRSRSSQLFEKNEIGEMFQERTVELWERIAARYAGNPIVAAYDLLNEPMNEFSRKKKDDEQLWEFYDRLYDAVRTADPTHIISVEGVWELHNLPDPTQYGWENMLYQTHNYNWKVGEIEDKLYSHKWYSYRNVPVLVGEFQAGGIWDEALQIYSEAGMSWMTWTYKGTKSPDDDWFLYRADDAPLVDPFTDSYEEILEKWSQVGTHQDFEQDVELTGILETYAGYAVEIQ